MISHVCRSEDKPREAEGVTGKERRGAVHNEVCTGGRGIVYALLCVSGGMAEIQSTAAGSEGLRGGEKMKMFGFRVTETVREEEAI